MPPFIPGHGLGHRPQPGPSLLKRFGAHPRALTTTARVESRLEIPYQYRERYDQGAEGACVGFSLSWAMSIFNRHFYDAGALYHAAQLIDPWPETPPEEGTSVEAGATVLMTQGHWRFVHGVTKAVALFEGIKEFRHAASVDELRTAISIGSPFVLGINWYANFDRPVWGDFGQGGNRWWIGRSTSELGAVRGGHAICGCGARDSIGAFTLVNSWGHDYPIVNIPYETVELLIREEGAEAIIPVDRP